MEGFFQEVKVADNWDGWKDGGRKVCEFAVEHVEDYKCHSKEYDGDEEIIHGYVVMFF